MSMSQPEDILLRLQDLEVTIDVRGGRVAPLRGCSMEVRRGETIGLVGESGSGKTMTALSIMGLLPHGGRVTGGSIVFNGRDLTSSPPDETRRIRGMDIGICLLYTSDAADEGSGADLPRPAPLTHPDDENR